MRGASPEKEMVHQELLEDVYSLHGIDEIDARILGFTYKSPKDVLTIGTNLGIPIAECYGRVRRLSSLGLLKRLQICSIFTPSRRKRTLFYANRDRVEVVACGKSYKIRVRRVGPPNGTLYQFAILL